MKLFEIKTKYSLDEHLKYNYAIYLRSKELKISIPLVLFVIILGIIVKNWIYVAIAALLPIVSFLSVYLNARKNYNSNKALKDAEIVVEFYDDHLIQKLEVGSYKVEHDKISKIIETKTHFYIMISRNQGVIIPKKEISKALEKHIKSIKISK